MTVEEERSDLAELKEKLIVENSENMRKIKEIEDKILLLLSNSQGDILDDEVLIATLAVSKITSDEINVAVAEADKTEKEIDATRELYRPVAFRGSILFFVISDLCTVDPMVTCPCSPTRSEIAIPRISSGRKSGERARGFCSPP